MRASQFTPFISKTAAQIAPFHVMKILGEAKSLEASGKDVIHLEIGEPDFPSLDCVNEAAHLATKQGLTHYTPSLGLPALRRKLAGFYLQFYHATVDAEQIVITPGSSTALQSVLTAILNPSDRVLLTDPSYPCNRQFVNLLHGQITTIPLQQQNNFQLTLEQVQHAWQDDTKAMIIASPANPTGTIIPQQTLYDIAGFLASKNSYLIVDEIYQGLVYERNAESILAHQNLPENVIVINSFSKYFGMTGWRLGWAIAPKHLIPVLDRLAQNLYLAAPTPAQYAALRVLDEDAIAELEQRRQQFAQRRQTLYNAMTEAGFTLASPPDGAFYLYWNISEYTADSFQFCERLLQKTGVAITPGHDFGEHLASQHVRIAYTTNEEKLIDAVQRIKQFIDTHH